MRNRQTGVSLGGLIAVAFVLVIVALLGFKVGPPYMNFLSAKKAIEAIAQEQPTGSPASVRKAYEGRQTIDNITQPDHKDLEVSKEGGQVSISFAYRAEVPLFWNVGVYMDFAATATPK